MAKRSHSLRGGNQKQTGLSQRQLRVGELIRQALSDILQREGLSEPGLQQVAVTVSEVRMTADLKRATCYVSPLGGGDSQRIVKALAAMAPHLSHQIGAKVRLKFTPRLLFQPDTTFDEVDRIARALRQPRVQADLDGGRDAPDTLERDTLERDTLERGTWEPDGNG